MGVVYNAMVVSRDEGYIAKISDYCNSLYSDKIRLFVETEPEKIEAELPFTEILFLDLDARKIDTRCICQLLEFYDKCVVFTGDGKSIESCLVNHGYVCGFLEKTVKLEAFLLAIKRAFVVLGGMEQTGEEVGEIKKNDFLAVPSVSKIDVLKVDKLLYCEAEGRYTTFYLEGGKTIVSSKNLGEYERQLPVNSFFRIHHKYLINMKKVASINKEGGRYCEMSDKKFLPISKRRQEKFNRFLNLK